jgi:phosphatidylserine/phosphatidylglycerophosphate/cardiolipin synthase-like enzyme
MAKFLNTSATNYFLEELIKDARERLVIISPFLKFNDRIKELLEDKDRMKIDIRIVYGKSELAPQEINWLKSLEFVRTSFCQNLHAKCYLNERGAIITSMNLYDFSQVNNNEMGIYIDREKESELYENTLEEAQRLVRVSDQVRLSAEKVEEASEPEERTDSEADEKPKEKHYDKLTTSKLAKEKGMRTQEFSEKLVAEGYATWDGDLLKITDDGKRAGGESRISKKYGPYIIWPRDLQPKNS